MKDWLTLIIVLLIIVIVFDGWRRMRNARYGKIRMSPAMKKRLKQKQEDYQEEDVVERAYTSELPNGGARVVGHRDPQVAPSKNSQDKSMRQPGAGDSGGRRNLREPEQARLNLDESVPLLMEEIRDTHKHTGHDLDQRIEPTFSATDYKQDQAEEDYQDEDLYEGEDYEDEDRAYEEELEYDRHYGRDVEDHSRDEDYEEDDEQDELDERDAEDSYGSAPATGGQKASLQPEPEEVLIINVMAHPGEMFNGAALLDTLLQCGMRYGNMDIFHRYSSPKGEGALLFSMANMVKPGTFDLDAMDEFETPGVSLFMTLPLDADSMQSFELMLNTAKTLAESLGGELKDEQRSVMTRQTIEHCRQRILDFERRRLFRRPR